MIPGFHPAAPPGSPEFSHLSTSGDVGLPPPSGGAGAVRIRDAGFHPASALGSPEFSRLRHWSVRVTTGAAITLVGPTSGIVTVPSGAFSVSIAATGFIGTVTLTPTTSSLGFFTPASLTASSAAPVQTFTYTPAVPGLHVLGLTNNAGLTNPAPVSYTAAAFVVAGGMTFLQLCQALRREAGISGAGPGSVLNQVGMYDRVVNWVREAYVRLQNRHPNWMWMRKPFTLTMTAGLDTYAVGVDTETGALMTRFSHWWPDDYDDPMRAYLEAGGIAGEYWLHYLPWENWRHLYRFGNVAPSQPIHVSVDDALRLVVGPKPNATFVMRGLYQRSAQILVNDGDIPEMPPQFHMLIVYQAMQLYAGYESAPEVLLSATTHANRLMRELERNQLPQIRLGGPLA